MLAPIALSSPLRPVRGCEEKEHHKRENNKINPIALDRTIQACTLIISTGRQCESGDPFEVQA